MSEEQPISRTQQKRESLALQNLAEKLSAFPREDIQKLDLPSEIIAALLKANEMKKRSGFRRQIRFIGGMLRKIDSSHISDALENKDEKNRQRTAFFHKAEQWRDLLIEGDTAVFDEIITAFPQADLQRLRTLARNAQKEKKNEKPPRSSRELFRALHGMIEKNQNPEVS